MGNKKKDPMRHFIFSLILVLIFEVALTGAESIYLEREKKGEGEYVGVLGDLDQATVEQVIRMLEVQKTYRSQGNFDFRLGNSLHSFKRRQLFTSDIYGNYTYRLPVEVKDTMGYGVRNCEIEVPIEVCFDYDSVMKYVRPDTERGKEAVKVVCEDGVEISGRFNQEALTVSFSVTVEKNGSKLYYLYFGKQNADDNGSSKKAAGREPVLPQTEHDEDIVDISKEDKFGFEWWVKLIKEDPFGVSFWKIKSVAAEGDIFPPEGSYSNRVDLKLSKTMKEVDTFDWLVFKDDVDIPVFEDSYLEYDIRAETTSPELTVGIFCRLHTSLSNAFSRRLFDHVTFEKGERDEQGVAGHLSTELNPYIAKKWYHRRLPLKEYEGKKIDHIFFKVQGTLDNPENAPDILTYYFDNVQVTRGDKPEVLIKELEMNRAWINR